MSPSERFSESADVSMVGITPQLLRQYEEAVPGTADRLFRMALEEVEHRRELEKAQFEAEVTVASNQAQEAFRGQVFAFLITLTFAGVGGYIINSGHPVAGTIFGGV